MTRCEDCGTKLSVNPDEKNLDLVPAKRGEHIYCQLCAKKYDEQEKKKGEKDDGKGRFQVEFNTQLDTADLDVHIIAGIGVNHCDL